MLRTCGEVGARACAHPTAPRPAKQESDAVLLLHGSAGSSALWRGLRQKLEPVYEVIAPDLIGYGSSPAWNGERDLTLQDEARRLEEAIPCCEGDFHLVGYSYGGAVALALALSEPRRIRSLTLIEPVFFPALGRQGEIDPLQMLQRVRERFAAALERRDREGAMRDFIDFWSGEGAWQQLPPRHRIAALAMAEKIRLDWEACFAFDPEAAGLAAISNRTLLVRGDRSPAPMIRLVDALHRLMPGSTHRIVTGASHLLPLTHEAELAAAVVAHLHIAAERRMA